MTGKPKAKTPVWEKCLWALVFLGLAVAGAMALFTAGREPHPGRGGSDERALARRLAYLENLPEVGWVEVEGNNVYIGFRRRPPDLRAVVNAAAFHGNQETGSGVHVWAVRGGYIGWRRGSREPGLICQATARGGRVEGSDC